LGVFLIDTPKLRKYS